jgi:hypothetical protein
MKTHEYEDLPSLRDLYEVVLDLVARNEILEKKVKSLSTMKQRTWNPDEELRRHMPSKSFREWCKTIVVTTEQLEYTFAEGHDEGVHKIVISLVSAENVPLQAFNQKKDAIYGYENDEWNKLTNDDLDYLYATIKQRLQKTFIKWVEINIPNASASEESQIRYLEYFKQVNGKKNPLNLRKPIYRALT